MFLNTPRHNGKKEALAQGEKQTAVDRLDTLFKQFALFLSALRDVTSYARLPSYLYVVVHTFLCEVTFLIVEAR